MILRHSLSVALFIGLCLLVEYYFGWTTLLEPWANQSPTTLLTALLVSLFTYWLRTMRLYDYFQQDMRGQFWLSFKLMLQHNLLNNLLPMRTGELSFPLLMSRYFAVPASRSVPALLWFRVMDLHALLAIGLLGASSYWLNGYQAATLVLLWLPLPWLMFIAQTALQQHLHRLPGARLVRLAEKLLTSLPQTRAEFWRGWGWTLINWVVKLAMFGWVLSLFAEIPLSAAVVGAIAGDLTSVLPIHGVAGAGTYEAGVVAGLLPFAIPADKALPAAINLHLFLLAATLGGGLISLLIPGKQHG